MSQSPTQQVRKNPDPFDILRAQAKDILRLSEFLKAAETMDAQNDGLRAELVRRCFQKIEHITIANVALYDQFHAIMKGAGDE